MVRTGKPVRFQDERAGRFYDTHDYPVFDRQGKVRAVAVYSRDITENTQVVQALLESEENFRSLAENASDGILIAAGEGVHVYANRRVSEITGYAIDEFLGTGIRGPGSTPMRRKISSGGSERGFETENGRSIMRPGSSERTGPRFRSRSRPRERCGKESRPPSSSCVI